MRCRAVVALQAHHTAAGLYGPSDTGFELEYRSIGRGGRTACGTLQPLPAAPGIVSVRTP